MKQSWLALLVSAGVATAAIAAIPAAIKSIDALEVSGQSL